MYVFEWFGGGRRDDGAKERGRVSDEEKRVHVSGFGPVGGAVVFMRENERETKARDGIDMLLSRPGKAGRELLHGAELTSRELLLELHPPASARTRTGKKNLFIWASFGKRGKGGERCG